MNRPPLTLWGEIVAQTGPLSGEAPKLRAWAVYAVRPRELEGVFADRLAAERYAAELLDKLGVRCTIEPCVHPDDE